MAGFREFVTGEVLTAANVNDFLMKQSVMVFADASARTTALGAEVAEGMLTYNEDTAQLEVFDGSAFVLAAPEPPAGIGSNVVQTVKTDTFTTTSTTFTDVTGLTVSITPTSDTSKVFIYVFVNYGAEAGAAALHARLRRGATDIFIGDAAGARTRATFAGSGDANQMQQATIAAVDSPATTSAVTYSLQIKSATVTIVGINRSRADTDNNAFARAVSSIIAVEVAA